MKGVRQLKSGALTKQFWWLIEDPASPRPVYFGNVFMKDCAIFSMYLRYYVLSTTTGADYLFYYRSTHTMATSLYQGARTKLCMHPETIGLIEH